MYLLLFLLLVWVVAVQAGCMAMRTPDREWPEKLRSKGQLIPPQFFDVPGAPGRTIHAVAITNADTLPWVVFLHGSPGSADAYLDYLADTILSRHAHLISMDRAGFGYSDFGHPEVSLQRQAEDVKGVVDRLAPGQKVILVGHSLGSPVIFRFAMDYPALVAGIVNVAGSVDPRMEPHPWWQNFLDVPPGKWLLPKSFWASNREIKHLESELEKMMPLWTSVHAPVHVIHAQNDQLVDVRNVDFCRRMLTNTSLRVTLLEKGDHFILWTRTDVVRQAILDLIAEQ
jgi:pimeloyl-ACP methyl ester carboxylesterase